MIVFTTILTLQLSKTYNYDDVASKQETFEIILSALLESKVWVDLIEKDHNLCQYKFRIHYPTYLDDSDLIISVAHSSLSKIHHCVFIQKIDCSDPVYNIMTYSDIIERLLKYGIKTKIEKEMIKEN